MNITQGVPTETGTTGDLARQLAWLMGTAYQSPDDSYNAADFLALASAIAGGRTTNLGALDEAFATTASQLLSELERQYGLEARPDMAAADRRVRLTAKIRAAVAGTPQNIITAVRAYDPTAALVENTALGVASTDPRAVFRFAVVLAAAVWGDDVARAAIQAVVDQMKPGYSSAVLTTRVGFRFDDPDSLFDRDCFGS